MSGQTAAKIPSSEYALTVLTGPETGVAYRLLGQAISLGRASDNDVVLQDGKSSRNHARIEKRGNEYWIKDLGSTAGILINNQPVKESILQPGDEILVGATLLRFAPPQGLSLIQSAPPAIPFNVPPLPHLPLTKNMNLSPDNLHNNLMQAPGNNPAPWQNPPNRTKYGGEQKSYLPLVVIAVLLIGAIALMNNHAKRRAGLKIKDDAALEEQIDSTEKDAQDMATVIAKTGKNTQQYAEAQNFYMRGFREFEAGNYGRAIQAFQAALSIYPNHPLAKRYLETSRIKNNQLVTEALERGERAFQLEKYNIAKNEYRTVELLTGDPGNKSYQLAEKKIERDRSDFPKR